MSDTVLTIGLAAGVTVPTNTPPPPTTPCECVFDRTLDANESGQPLPVIRDVVRGSLNTSLAGTLTLPDPTPGSLAEVRFLTGPGSLKEVATLRLPEAAGTAARLELNAAQVATISAPEPRPPAQPDSVRRDARFVPIDGALIGFATANLAVSPITVGGSGWTNLGLDKHFALATPATTERPHSGALPAALAGVAWTPTHLAVDGQFTAWFQRGQGDAWLWWLTGAAGAMGVVLDDLTKDVSRLISIPLPPLPASLPGETETPGRRAVPADVTEREVADNPAIYTEDPGAFCEPFSNPERVLGERSFNVIYRAEQPVVSPEASVRTVTGPLLDFELPAAVRDAAIMAADREPSLIRRIASRLGLGRAPTAVTAANRLPAVHAVVTRDALPAGLLDEVQRADRVRRVVDARHPVQWDSDASRYQAVTVARGHILEFRLRTRSNGYSLGTVAKTLTLAARQVKRIQKIEWRRVERTRREERTQLLDRVSDVVSRDRQYDDAVEATLSEWSRGESESSSSAGAGGFGFAAAGIVIGGGGGGSNASAESSQQGGRRTTASEEQRLRDTVRRYGDSLRRLDSVVVNEVTQEEDVTGTVEIVRNPNFGHALTVIYYQILRHLKVETAFAGVRECLFVPFAIKPFTIARAFRWRDLLRRGLLDRRFDQPIRYLRDVLTGFAGSDIPPGRRSEQRIRHVSGSLYLTLAVGRPRDTDEGTYDAAAWAVLNPYLAVPAAGVQAQLNALPEAQRDRQFQAEHAPVIAAAWLNTMRIQASGMPLAADLTLATRYQYNGTIRVDFSAPVGGVLTRELLASIRVYATQNLSPDSVVNLTRLTITYQTDQFQRTFSATGGAGDLISPSTGVRDSGATVFSLPDSWERQDVRVETVRAVNDLIGHLNEHAEHYHKVIWWNMDRDRVFMLVDGFTVPGTPGSSIGSVIERDPIAIIGNCLVFRVSAGSFLGLGDIVTPAQLYNYYATHQPVADPILISLPTDGLYAQTIMDKCEALEEHYGSTDWVLTDREPELGELDASLLTSRRAEPQPATPTPLPQTLINLQNAPEAPAPAGLAGVLNAVTDPNAFRDMAGLAGTQANAAAALQTAAALATNFGNQAAALKLAQTAKAAQSAGSADQRLATVQRAVNKELATPEEGRQHANEILSELHGPTSSPPHETRTFTDAIEAISGVRGGAAEATTPDGQVRVSLASLQTVPSQVGPAAPVAPASPPLTRIDGIDLHHAHQFPPIADLRADGIQFAMLKATQRHNFIDPQFVNRRAIARAGHFLSGTYHFYEGAVGMLPQANNLVTAVARLLPGDLPPAFDFETGPRTASAPQGIGAPAAGLRGAQWLAPLETFLDRVEVALGRTPLIYTSWQVWHDWIQDDPAFARFGDYPLWVKQQFDPAANRYARRLTRNPRLPAPWDDWAMWQYSLDFTPIEFTNLHAADPDTDLDVSSGGIHVVRGLADLGRPAPHGNGVRFVAHADEDGVIRLLTFVGFWLESSLSDLAQSVGGTARPLAAGDVTACDLGDRQFVAFRERSDGHLYEIERQNGGFSVVDITSLTGTMNPAGDPTYVTSGADRHLVCRGDDDHQYLFSNPANGGWQARDVTAGAGIANASGQARAYVSGADVHVVGRAGDDGHLVEAWHDGTGWNTVDRTTVGVPAATYQPSTYQGTDGFVRVVYRALRGVIHESDHHATDLDLTQASGGAPTAAGSPASAMVGQAPHIIYRRPDGYLHEIFWNGAAWAHGQLPCQERAAADPAALVITEAGASVVIVTFRRRDGAMQEITLRGGTWSCEAVEPVPNEPPQDSGVSGGGASTSVTV